MDSIKVTQWTQNQMMYFLTTMPPFPSFLFASTAAWQQCSRSRESRAANIILIIAPLCSVGRMKGEKEDTVNVGRYRASQTTLYRSPYMYSFCKCTVLCLIIRALNSIPYILHTFYASANVFWNQSPLYRKGREGMR